jgi:hypothetical protein
MGKNRLIFFQKFHPKMSSDYFIQKLPDNYGETRAGSGLKNAGLGFTLRAWVLI